MRHACAATMLILAGAATTCGASTPVSPSEQAEWLRWLLPLPKQISIDGKVELPAADVRVVLARGSGRVVQTAADELRAFLGDAEGGEQGRFEILLGVCGSDGKLDDLAVPGAAGLAELPHHEQAYVVRPVGDNKLVLAALDSRGVYYAAQTVRQLLEGKRCQGRLTIPLATITDWPDLEERGLWGGSADRDIVWMAQHKMNLVESHATLSMTDDGRGRAKADQQLIDQARAHALNLVPYISHLNGLRRTGIYRAYPELMGQGKQAVLAHHPHLVAPCCSQPKLAEILADWMSDLAEQRGVSHVCVWLSELRNQYCDCPACRQAGVGQYALEARCLVRAYRMAQKKHSGLKLRILLTQGSYSTNDKVLAEIPPDVGVTYYDGSRTYDSSRDPMIYPLLEEYVAEGGWLGCYPQLIPSWRLVSAWSCPQFIHARMNEFVDKKLACLCGYAPPDNRLCEFNVLAAAEWAWNAKGRDTRQFAAAWATRRGIDDADAAAEWAVTLGPVGWDVYGARVPHSYFFGQAATSVARGRKPTLGEGMFRYFPSAQHFDDDLAACQHAMAIATQLDQPLLIAETQVIEGYVRMLEAIYTLGGQVAASKHLSHDERVAMQKTLGRLCVAGIETADALRMWEGLCHREGESPVNSTQLSDTIDVTGQTVADIARALQKLGISNPVASYVRQKIGDWTTDDFDSGSRITKSFDVTSCVVKPGVYQVGFKYTGGWNGLGITRVALAKADDEGSGEPSELSVDEHSGSAAHRNRANVYTLTLDERDPSARYVVVASIRGTPRAGRPPERQGCNGSVWIQGNMPDNWRATIEAAVPLPESP